MLVLNRFDNIYFYRPPVDFRRGIFGLCSIIQNEMELSPFNNYLFFFTNRTRDRIKAVYWDKTGFAMWYKILEQDKYKWPFHLEENNIKVNVEKLNDFLKGLNPWQLPHKILDYEII